MSAKQNIGFTIVSIMLIAGGLLAIFIGPIAQTSSYHLFSDYRYFFSIPNFLNVISNLPFLLIGLIALQRLLVNKIVILDEIRLIYLILFTGVILVGLGSGYYHLWPINQTLVWDRIPMTIVFMSLFSIIIAEYISIRMAKMIVWPLLIMGVMSVIYWHLGEKAGQGDLRFYGLIQFLPILMMPVILICFNSRFTHASVYWWLLPLYLFAKLFEHFDQQIYLLLGILSGHTLKHLFAALAIGVVVYGYTIRTDKKTVH